MKCWEKFYNVKRNLCDIYTEKINRIYSAPSYSSQNLFPREEVRNFAKKETRIFTLEKSTVCFNNHQTRSTSFKEQEKEEEEEGGEIEKDA